MRATMRILVTAEAASGIWPYSLDLARGLSRLGAETVIALLGPSPSEQQRAAASLVPGLELVETGLPSDRSAEDGGTARRAGAGIARLAHACGVDLVHLNMPALAAETAFGLPVVAVQHGCVATWWEAVHGTPLPPRFAWRSEQIKAGLHAAHIVVTPTDAHGERVRRHYDLLEPPRTVHHGRTVSPPRRAPQHDFVLTAGRLWDAGKNLATLDAAAGALGVRVHAAGPCRTPHGGEVIFDNIQPLGILDEEALGLWLSARPVFVSCALYEPSGLAVLEAAAAGCPLVLSDIPAFRELWDEVAVFVDPRDERGFTAAIARLVGDDFERAVIGRAAKERAARRTADAMAAQMAFLYRSLLPAIRRPVLAALAA
jgi:glycosyltransferase involved in cell wall biosynthesis